MAVQAQGLRRFVRRTQLAPGEYRKNFRQVDIDVIAAVTSREADRVTPLMSKIYLRLVNAPAHYWESEGVLRFEGEPRDEAYVKAWDTLCEVLCVASATASKAVRWMHEQGIIGYFAGKNGAGIRVFINRAESSIGSRPVNKKFLEFTGASFGVPRASSNEAAFNDSYAVLEVLEKDLNPRAPKSGAGTGAVLNNPPARTRPHVFVERPITKGEGGGVTRDMGLATAEPVAEVLGRLRTELELCVREAASRAAAQSVSHEMERTREWFETKALPKAVRVAQRETYDLLRRQSLAGGKRSAGLEVGSGPGACAPTGGRPLTLEGLREAAEVCVALLEAQGRPVEATLSALSSEAGGWLTPEDVPRVRELAATLASGGEPPPL